jgi:hypothetical protein
MRKAVLFFSILINISLFAQQGEWFPDKLNIQPFTANMIEPKAGFQFMDNKKIRLDIGTSTDFYHYTNGSSVLSFGGDLFTYTRLRKEKDFHFPVEAVDYLFGVNAGYKVTEGHVEYGARLRLSHISAHFVDGQYDYTIAGWRNNTHPRVYSREFLELFPYYRYEGLRGYVGLTYLFHVSPVEIGKGIYQAGFDYYIPGLVKAFSPFIAYDFKLAEYEKFYGNNIITAGIKFGNFKERGFSLNASYYTGKSVHGEYFDKNEKYFTFGFNLDL